MVYHEFEIKLLDFDFCPDKALTFAI